MPLPKIADARSLSDEELVEQILAVKRELFDLRLLRATQRLEKPHQFKHTRHRLAQLMTVEHERQLAAPTSLKSRRQRRKEKYAQDGDHALKAKTQVSVTPVEPEPEPSVLSEEVETVLAQKE